MSPKYAKNTVIPIGMKISTRNQNIELAPWKLRNS